MKESLLKLKIFYSYFCVQGMRDQSLSEISDYEGIIDGAEPKKLINYKFLVQVSPLEGLSYYYVMNRQAIDAVMDTEVGLNIQALYSYDIPAKILQFY